MRWQGIVVGAVLLAAWGGFAAWQYHACLHERELIAETLHQPAKSVMNALLGGMRSHRRMGRFFEVQLQGLLDELAQSPDVLAVAVQSEQGETLLSAEQTEGLVAALPHAVGAHWLDAGFALVELCDLQPAGPRDSPGRPGRGQGCADVAGAGPQAFAVGEQATGAGPGRGLGRGRGQGPMWLQNDDASDGPFGRGGRFYASLLLDRTRYDKLLARSARSHIFVTLAGGLAAILLGLAWHVSVRLVTAQGRTRVLETEARHLRELSQAAAGLAHETRNPLGLIRGWTQRLADTEVDDLDRRQYAQVVLEECDRVTARINQFLAFARPAVPRVAPVDACAIVDELRIILQPDLEAKKVTLACPLPPVAPPLLADRELLRQAIFNLVQNAVQFAPEGETVTIGVLNGSNGDCRIEVADRGPGVPEEARPSLFTPYFTTRPDGTGLGLAMVRRIAAAHGWEATYRPRPGGGAVFALEGIHGRNEAHHPGG